ncbi:hypothetical protein [Flexithrix dorotheae]|uniref:hypothetical protein n=1 Tax=Flexithrix dorotheae TaxID=70993 RepID=UPI0003704946|nr:hypothetical protein [Flexithrix dorotheae]
MNFLVKIILILVFGSLFQLFFPWWTIALVSGIVIFVNGGKGFNSFLTGFIGVGMLWFGYAFIIDQETGAILTEKVSKIFFLPHPFLLILVTGLIGGIVGGFSALTGSFLREIVLKNH